MLRTVRFVENVIDTIRDKCGLDRSIPVDPSLSQQLLADLRRFAGESARCGDFWGEICQSLLHCAETGNPASFMRWPPIARTMVPRTGRYTIAAYRALRSSAHWTDRWEPILHRPTIGRPPACLPDLRTDNLTVQHASHLHAFRKLCGVEWYDADCIVEFGAGFGSMCRTVHQLGFRGRYIIFDLPPITALQRFYLAAHGIQADYAPGRSVQLCHRLEDVAAVMPPSADRLSAISTWALSEMPLALRADIEVMLERCGRILLAYQAEFEGNDNARYFDSLGHRLARSFDLHVAEIDGHAGNRYMFGLAKAHRPLA
ncbi:MAG: hypothetical protein JNK67_14235 [Alphaproteobacteria bacterium]|nr:hypothetical protein [Alphaproteobacteria bacterium]